MEEVKFCEDCKWCDINYLPWYKRIGFRLCRRCLHPKLNYYRVSRSDAAPCYELRRNGGSCGREGKCYEPKEVK